MTFHAFPFFVFFLLWHPLFFKIVLHSWEYLQQFAHKNIFGAKAAWMSRIIYAFVCMELSSIGVLAYVQCLYTVWGILLDWAEWRAANKPAIAGIPITMHVWRVNPCYYCHASTIHLNFLQNCFISVWGRMFTHSEVQNVGHRSCLAGLPRSIHVHTPQKDSSMWKLGI